MIFKLSRCFGVFTEPTLPNIYLPEVAIIREEGTNGDREMAAAVMTAGFIAVDVTGTDMLLDNFDFDRFRGIFFPGGFSFAGNLFI